jgi:hypothetical protein
MKEIVIKFGDKEYRWTDGSNRVDIIDKDLMPMAFYSLKNGTFDEFKESVPNINENIYYDTYLKAKNENKNKLK